MQHNFIKWCLARSTNQGNPETNDADLRWKQIDRIFDVYVSSADLNKGDVYATNPVKCLDPERCYLSHKINELLGKEMPKNAILGNDRGAGAPISVPFFATAP